MWQQKLPRGTEAFRQTEEKKKNDARLYDHLLTGNIRQDDRNTKWLGSSQSVSLRVALWKKLAGSS